MVNDILIIDCGSSKVPNICNLVTDFGANIQLVKMQDLNPEHVENCNGIIISGAPILITKSDKEKLLQPFLFLKNCQIPILGICFGHQVIGMLFGAEMFLGKEVRTNIPINIVYNSPLFEGIETSQIIVSQDHTEGITLPKDFILLANSDDYPNEAMQHKTKKIFGVQFHPETSSDLVKKIITNFLRLCSHNNP
ncbi:MAG: glutamine amidotransferase-related protein [Bacteroidia bacterium]